MAEEKNNLVYHYFNLKGRGYAALLGKALWNKEMEWIKYDVSEWRAGKYDKSFLPFQQLPLLIEGDYSLGQSNSIVRYLGRKWGKEPDFTCDPARYGLYQALIEESWDIFEVAYNAFKSGQWDTGFKKLPKHFTNLEKLMTGDKFMGEIMMSDLSIFAAISVVLDCWPNALKGFSKLQSWYNKIESNPAVKSLNDSIPKYIASPKPTLYYFDGEGRAQIIRYAFDKGNVVFEDKRLTGEEFGALKKDSSSVVGQRFGSVPIVEHNGKIFAQSIACAQYAAELSINANVTPQQRAIDMQLLATHADIQTAVIKCKFGDEKSMENGKKVLPKQVEKFFGGLERILPDSGFVNGRSTLTIGDIAIYDTVVNNFLGIEKMKQSIDSYPKVKALVKAVKNYQPSEEKKHDIIKYEGKPRLIYFDAPGRAELTRLCFHAGGIEFKDERLSNEQFQAAKKDLSHPVAQRFGSVPILVHDSLHIAQSMACCQYAADLGINAHLTPLQRAIDVQILGAHAEVQSAMLKCLFGTDSEKAKGKNDLPAAFDKFFSAFERIYPDDGFLHGGSSPTLGDLAIYDLVSSQFPGLIKLGQSIDKFPKIQALVKAVQNYKPLGDYLIGRGDIKPNYMVISYKLDKRFHTKEFGDESSAEVYWKQLSEKFGSVLFHDKDREQVWSILKTKGPEDATNRVIKHKNGYLKAEK